MATFDHTHVSLTIDKGKLTARVAASSAALDQGLRLCAEEVLAFLRQQGLVNVDEAAVLAWADSEDQSEPVIVANGVPPTSGEDGRLEYLFQQEEQAHKENRSQVETVDYKDWFSLPTVSRGDVLARVHPPVAGTDGVDVFGTPIPFKPGRTPKIVVGKNVELRDEEGVAVSAVDGLAVFRGRILEVSPTYVVNGDVNLRTGNIRFNGDVLVRGRVIEDFLVEATGNVTVEKSVDRGSVKAEGCVVVEGGVYGKDGVAVEAGQDLTVHHAENATLRADGGLTVTHAALQSCLTAQTITIGTKTEGYVRGGELQATSDIVVATVGSPGISAMTRISIGWDRSLIGKLCTYREQREDMQERRTYLDEQIVKLRRMAEAGRTLTSAQNARLGELEREAHALREQETGIQHEQSVLEETLRAGRSSTITILTEMHPDAVLAIHGKEIMVDECHGPLRLRLGKDRLELLPVESPVEA